MHKMRKLAVTPLYSPGAIFISLVVISILLLSYTVGATIYPKIVAGGLILFFIYNSLVLRKSLSVPLEYKLVAAWIIMCVLSVVIALDMDVAESKLVTIIMVIPMAFAVYNFILWNRSPKAVWFGFVLGTLVMCYLEYKSGLARLSDERLSGTAGNANQFAYVLVVAVIFLMHAVFSVKNLAVRTLILAPLAVTAYFVPMTGSRQGLITLLLVMIVYAYLKINFRGARNMLRSIMVVLVFAVAVAVTFTYAKSSSSYIRLMDFVASLESGKIEESGTTGQSAKYRYLFYKYGLDIASNKPFGVGLDNFKVALTQYPEFKSASGAYAHSNYIEVLVDTGILGFGLYYWVYVVIARRLLSLRRLRARMNNNDIQLYHTSIVLFSVIIVTDFTMVSYYDKATWIVFASLIASIQLLLRSQSDASNEQKSSEVASESSNSRIVTSVGKYPARALLGSRCKGEGL